MNLYKILTESAKYGDDEGSLMLLDVFNSIFTSIAAASMFSKDQSRSRKCDS